MLRLDQLKLALPGRYEIERLLGSGGMATVYLARDNQQSRRVAVKVLRPELAGAVGQDRFLREIRIASALNHPHILPLLDSGTAEVNGDALPFYVMPYVEGESLRDRLNREKQLPIDDVIGIARDIAAALDYAHGHGVIHRDIKPENILLTGHQAVVADFGIARAIDRSSDPETLTTRGVAIGTAAYMSPEQASAQPELDGRTDIYSLGCVVYEMLGGDPPFSGSSANAIAARHRVDTVPPLRTIRPSVPLALEAAVLRALEKIPADRFNNAEQFATALTHQHTPTAATWIRLFSGRNQRRTWILLAAFLVVAAGTVYAILSDSDRRRGPRGEVLDTTQIAIIPAQLDAAGSQELDPALLLQDAMARWSGITLKDHLQVRDAMARRGTMKGGDWRRVASEIGAGRYVRVDAIPVGDSVRVHATLYDTGEGTQLADSSVWVAADFAGSSATYNKLAETLLFRGEGPRTPMDSLVGTSSAPARQAFAQGREALADWNLPAADSAFDAAGRFDPQYAQALMWLALVRSWSGLPVAQWRSAAERAASGLVRLSQREREIVDAVLAQSREDNAKACGIWSRLAAQDAYSFVVWYGWGDCLRRDDVVVRSATSPTGWRFRSSYHQALQAYQRAFQLLPSIHRSFSSTSFSSVRNLLTPSDNDLRGGRTVTPDTFTFVAAASWQGDSLVFFPIRANEMAQGRSPRSSSTSEAVRHQRLIFHDIAAGWVSAFPRSAAAMEALAISLDVLGDASALDTLRRALTLATTPHERLRVSGAEVWMQVKFSLPAGLTGLREARLLADSLLNANTGAEVEEPRLLASLAALIGRASLAARLSRDPRVRESWGVPIGLASSGPPFLVYAAMGGPRDSLLYLERQVGNAIDRELSKSAQPVARLQWLAYPATIAFPEYQLGSITNLAGAGDYLVDAQAAWVRHDTSAILATFDGLRKERQSYRAADLPLDALLPEAWLLAAVGDEAGSRQWLDPTLNSLTGAAPQTFADALRAGPLVRAMVFRAELADRMHDSGTARRWAAAVVALWSGADDFLQPTVKRMETLTR